MPEVETVVAQLRGMTWDHPRGYRALVALDALGGLQNQVTVNWDRQPLSGFEARPLRELAVDHDLIVIDHPGLGESIRDGALLPIGELFPAAQLASWRDSTVGASFDSYAMDNRQWAVPIDAAAQVAVLDAELLESKLHDAAPELWSDSLRLARRVPTALCLGGPHALLMYQAICVALASPTASDPWLDRSTGVAALALMADLLAVADRELSLGDPITVLDALAAGRVAYCPLVYGYVTYQDAAAGRPLRAVDAAAGVTGGRRGSVLGGTGIAVSAFCAHPEAAAAVIRQLLAPEVQGPFFAVHGGQGATADCWADAEIDAATGRFYSRTTATLTEAWVRPRFAGYVPFQRDGSAIVRNGLLAAADPEAVFDALLARYRTAVPE